MFDTFCSFEMRNAQCTVEENGPDFLLLKYTIFFVSDNNFICKTVIDIFKDEDNFVKGGAEGVIDFGVGFLQVEYIIVFGCEFGREFEEGLLEGLL